MGYSRKTPTRGGGGGGGMRTWNFPEYRRNSLWKLQGLSKKEVQFLGVIKKVNVEFLGVLVLDLEIGLEGV